MTVFETVKSVVEHVGNSSVVSNPVLAGSCAGVSYGFYNLVANNEFNPVERPIYNTAMVGLSAGVYAAGAGLVAKLLPTSAYKYFGGALCASALYYTYKGTVNELLGVHEYVDQRREMFQRVVQIGNRYEYHGNDYTLVMEIVPKKTTTNEESDA